MPPAPKKRTKPKRARLPGAAGGQRATGVAPRAARGAIWIGAALGVWLTSDGLWARLFGTYLFPPAWHSVWKSLSWAQNISAYDLGWPLVVLGAGWSGALAGLGLGRRWAHRAALVLSVASLPWLGASTILGVGSLACLLSPSVRRWIEGRQAE